MARKRNEEYIGDSDDGEFEEEPVESFEDPEGFVDDVADDGKIFSPHIQLNVIANYENPVKVQNRDAIQLISVD